MLTVASNCESRILIILSTMPLYECHTDDSRPTSTVQQQPLPPPRSSQPIERRNVFDDDEFDKLAVDASRLHIGRRGKELTADNILSDRSKAPAKSSILAALAAFDSDDDERDDTYDAEDVGASVDNATAGPDEVDADKNEEALFRAYSMTPDLFGRDADTRRGKARTALKSETGMTDEAIEGWAIMLARDPKRIRRLEAKFSTFAGQQRELAPTSWRSMPAGSGDEGGEASGAARGGGSHRGRGRGMGRGRGGNVAGPVDDKTTQIARQRKDANKASRANHSRKDQRGKKMARAGFSG
jgi:activating signal cointegrator complex subunit 2